MDDQLKLFLTKIMRNKASWNFCLDCSVGRFNSTNIPTYVFYQQGKRFFFLLHRVKTGSGAHPASHPKSTAGSFFGAKAAKV
jgi:hypothetical protein